MKILRFHAWVGVLALFVALSGQAYAGNLFTTSTITIDPTYTSPVIAGFPLDNMFGANILTPEGVADTIFTDSGPGYRNVFFHMTDGLPRTLVGFRVTGSTDGPTNGNRAFSYVRLFTFTDVLNPLTYSLLFDSGPVTPNAGFELVQGNINLSAGPNFVVQFGALDGDLTYHGPRVFRVAAFDTPVPEPGAFIPLALIAAGVVTRRLRNRRLGAAA